MKSSPSYLTCHNIGQAEQGDIVLRVRLRLFSTMENRCLRYAKYLSCASRDVTVAYIISHIHRQNLGKFRHGAMGSGSNVYVLGINV